MAEEPGLSPGSYSKGVGTVGELLPPKDGRDLVTLHTDELLTTLIPRLDTMLFIELITLIICKSF